MRDNRYYTLPQNIHMAADYALDQIDWSRVQRVMEFLDWKWATNGGHVPVQLELRERARMLCVDAYYGSLKEESEYFISTGGLLVRCDAAENWFRISFELEHGDSYRGD